MIFHATASQPIFNIPPCLLQCWTNRWLAKTSFEMHELSCHSSSNWEEKRKKHLLLIIGLVFWSVIFFVIIIFTFLRNGWMVEAIPVMESVKNSHYFISLVSDIFFVLWSLQLLTTSKSESSFVTARFFPEVFSPQHRLIYWMSFLSTSAVMGESSKWHIPFDFFSFFLFFSFARQELPLNFKWEKAIAWGKGDVE